MKDIILIVIRWYISFALSKKVKGLISCYSKQRDKAAAKAFFKGRRS